MPSNVPLNPGTGGPIATTKQRLHDGDTTQSQVVTLAGVSGTEDAYTFSDINGDSANGLDVDVTRLPSLPAGTNNIGDVDVLSLPSIPAGNNNIGDVDVVTLPGFMQPFEPSEAEQTISTTTSFANTAINGTAGVSLFIANEGNPASGEDIIVKVGTGAQVDNDTGTFRRRIYAGTFGTIVIPNAGSLQIGIKSTAGTPTVRIQRGTGSL